MHMTRWAVSHLGALGLVMKLSTPLGTFKQTFSRRALLKLLTALGLPFGASALANAEQESPTSGASPEGKLRPQVGDKLVYDGGERNGRPITLEHLEMNAKPIAAFPMTADGATVRNGSRLNRVLVLRLPEADLTAKTARYSAQGVVAYSAVCTHTGCDVELWNSSSRHLVCPCHGSEFDSLDEATVVQGPAPQPLALLPVSIANNEVIVAGNFSRRVGFQQQQQ
jgi:rieske iron-sulfur protein